MHHTQDVVTDDKTGLLAVNLVFPRCQGVVDDKTIHYTQEVVADDKTGLLI